MMQEYIQKLQTRYVDEPVKWATIAGFVLMIIGVFGAWATVNVMGLVSVSTNGFDHNGTLVFILSLVGLAAIAVYAFSNVNVQQVQLLWGLVAVAVIIDVLVLINFIDILTSSGVRPGWGLWLTVIGAAALSVGAIVPMWGEIRSRADQARNSGGGSSGSGGDS
jgi:hypothetical protein